MISDSQRKPYSSLRGAGNSLSPWGAIPVILGEHYIAPPYAGSPYTEIGGTDGIDQYVHLSFILGYGPMEVRDLRIGENAFAFVETTPPTAKGDPLPIGTDMTITGAAFLSSSGSAAKLQYDALPMDWYPSRIKESQFSMEVKRGTVSPATAVSLYQTTPPGTTKIEVDIEFPSGLIDGDAGTAAVGFTIKYRDALVSGSAWSDLVSAVVLSRAKSQLLRYTYSKGSLAAGTYEVQVTRTSNDQASDSKVKDSFNWTALRCTIGTQDVVNSAVASKVLRLSMRIKSGPVINGSIGTINAICKSKVPAWDGAGSGPSHWGAATATDNPAALALSILRGTANGHPIADADIDYPAFESLYQWCVDRNTAGKPQMCNAILDGQLPLKEAVNKVLSTARAQLSLIGTTYSIVHDGVKSTYAALITPRNSWGFQSSKSFQKVPHAFRVQYINAVAGFQQDERLVLGDAYLYPYSIGGVVALYDAWGHTGTGYQVGDTFLPDPTKKYALATRIETISRWGVTDPEMAFREGRYLLASRILRPETYTVNQDYQSIGYTRGDLVSLGHDVPLFGQIGGRVKACDGTTLVSDEIVTMVAGKSYGIRYQLNASGLVGTADVTLDVGSTFTFTISGCSIAHPEADDMFWFGEHAEEAVDCIVVGIEPGDELSARITLQDYSSGIQTSDSGTIPAFDSNVTLPVTVNFGDAYGITAGNSSTTAVATVIGNTAVATAAGLATAAETNAKAAVPSLTPRYVGVFQYGSLPITANVDDYCLVWSDTSSQCGIYKWTTAWSFQPTPTTAMLGSAWPDILTVVNAGHPSDAFDSETRVSVFVGAGVNFVNILAANVAFINELFAKQITLLTGGFIQSDGFTPGSSGFRIDTTGDAEFNSASIRGDTEGPVFSTGFAHSRLIAPQNARGVPGTNLRKVGPVMTKWALPTSDANGPRYMVESPCVIFDDYSHKYVMLFTGGFGTSDATCIESIYRAESDDGIVWGPAVVLKQGTANDHFTGPVLYQEVAYGTSGVGSKYLFYIHLTATGYEGGVPHIDLTTYNADFNNPVDITGAMLEVDNTIEDPIDGRHWLGDCVWHPNIVKHRGKYYMFFNASEYSVGAGNGNESIGCAWATSLTGPWTVFHKYILSYGATGETTNVGDPCVYFEEGWWYMAYYGYDGTDANDRILYCTDANFPGVSDSATTWGAYGANPVLVKSGLGSDLNPATEYGPGLDPDSKFAHKPYILQRNGVHYHYYTGVAKAGLEGESDHPYRCIMLAIDGVPGTGASYIQSRDASFTYQTIREYSGSNGSDDNRGYFVLVKPIMAHLIDVNLIEILVASSTWVSLGYTSLPYVIALNPGVYRIRNAGGYTGKVRAVGAYGTERLENLAWTDTWPNP